MTSILVREIAGGEVGRGASTLVRSPGSNLDKNFSKSLIYEFNILPNSAKLI